MKGNAEMFAHAVENLVRNYSFPVDCLGLIAVAAARCGVLLPTPDWRSAVKPSTLMDRLAPRHADKVEFRDLRRGDILQFRLLETKVHLGVAVSTKAFVHYDDRSGRPRRDLLRGFWRKALVAAWRLRWPQ